MRNPNKRLLALIKKHELTSGQVAELCRVSPNTVSHWRANESHAGHRAMPHGYLELLEIKLNEKKGE